MNKKMNENVVNQRETDTDETILGGEQRFTNISQAYFFRTTALIATVTDNGWVYRVVFPVHGDESIVFELSAEGPRNSPLFWPRAYLLTALQTDLWVRIFSKAAVTSDHDLDGQGYLMGETYRPGAQMPDKNTYFTIIILKYVDIVLDFYRFVVNYIPGSWNNKYVVPMLYAEGLGSMQDDLLFSYAMLAIHKTRAVSENLGISYENKKSP